MMTKKIATRLSIALVVAYWIYSLSRFLIPGYTQDVTSVKQLVLFVSIKASIALALILPLLRGCGERLRDLGFSAHDFRRAVWRGLGFALLLYVLMNVVLASVMHALKIGTDGPSPAMVALFHDRRQALYWVFCGIVGGGFTEELIRAFILTRFQSAFGRWGLVVAIAVDAVQFGSSHLYQGPRVAVSTGIQAVLFSLIFLSRRRVADTMVTHALFDLAGIFIAYAIFGGRG